MFTTRLTYHLNYYEYFGILLLSLWFCLFGGFVSFVVVAAVWLVLFVGFF